jgi:PilZ domain-containing protein
MEERRRARRIRTLKAARIVIDPNASALDCIVRNLSPHGALLLVSSLAVPDHFELLFSASRARHHCRVAWRAMDRVGVEFKQAS